MVICRFNVKKCFLLLYFCGKLDALLLKKFGVGNLKTEINTFIQQGSIKLIIIYIYNVLKKYI